MLRIRWGVSNRQRDRTVSTVRVGIPVRAFARLERLARAREDDGARDSMLMDPLDVMELALTAGLPASSAEAGAAEYAHRESVRSAELLARLPLPARMGRAAVESRLPEANVVVYRMGPPRALGPGLDDSGDDVVSILDDSRPAEDGGYRRRRLGMSVADSAGTVWESARGYWSARPDAEYVVPTRWGYAPYVFRVADWRTRPNGRIWADRGWLITSHAAIPMAEVAHRSGNPPSLDLYEPDVLRAEPRTENDVAVYSALAGEILGLGARGANSVLRLRQRGRVLHCAGARHSR